MHLPDPRIYPSAHEVKNSVVQQLTAVLAEKDPQRKAEKQALLVFLLSQYLERNDQDALVVALSLAPSQAAYHHLWQTIKSLLLPADSVTQAQIFAIPVILVAGSKSATTLPGKLGQTDAVVALLKKHHIIHSEADISLSGQLYTADALAEISLPQLYRWQSALQYASGGLPITLETQPIPVAGQGVFLRYLLGIAIKTESVAEPVRLNQQVGVWGTSLAECIRQDLQQEGSTLFAIPRQPQALLDALDNGQYIYLDISLQVFVSDAIKKLRERGETPAASISCHDSNEIKLVISSQETPDKWDSFIWPLRALDYPAQIGQAMDTLLRECQVDNITLLTTIQPAQENGQRLFITPARASHYQHEVQ